MREQMAQRSSDGMERAGGSSITHTLQPAQARLSPDMMNERLEKGLFEEEVQANLNPTSVVEIARSWGKVWVLEKGISPIFFDIRGRLIDCGWFEYHNLVSDLHSTTESVALHTRRTGQLTTKGTP